MNKLFFYTFALFSFIGLTETKQDENEKRDYKNTDLSVLQTYKDNHTHQTLEFVLHKKSQYIAHKRKKLTMWEVAQDLESFIDESDPDLHQGQIVHALQVAEAMKKDGLPEEWIVAGFIHDFGKVLYTFGEPQWAVVGDTFPVGCQFSDTIVYHEFFKENPDYFNPQLNTRYGIYQRHCGLDAVHLSWGHDEYLYQAIKDSRLPEEAKYAIRYHSFYPWHQEGAYQDLMNEKDHAMLKYVKLLNSYDLYTKVDEKINSNNLLPFYKKLISKYFPEPLWW